MDEVDRYLDLKLMDTLTKIFFGSTTYITEVMYTEDCVIVACLLKKKIPAYNTMGLEQNIIKLKVRMILIPYYRKPRTRGCYIIELPRKPYT